MNDLDHAIKVARYRNPRMRTLQIILNAVQHCRPDVPNAELHSLLFYLDDAKVAEMVLQYAAWQAETERKIA